MKIHELLEEMTRYQHKVEVYLMLEEALSEFVPSDTGGGTASLTAEGCATPVVSQDSFADVIFEVFTLKEQAKAGLAALQNIEVDYEKSEEEEENE